MGKSRESGTAMSFQVLTFLDLDDSLQWYDKTSWNGYIMSWETDRKQAMSSSGHTKHRFEFCDRACRSMTNVTRLLSKPLNSQMSLSGQVASLLARTGLFAVRTTFNYAFTTTTPPRRSPHSKRIQTTSEQSLYTRHNLLSLPPRMT